MKKKRSKHIEFVEMYRVRVKALLESPYKNIFLPYKDDDKEDIHIYAMGICLPLDTPIMKKFIKTLEKYYSLANKEEKKTDFADFDFDKQGHLILNERAKELGKCQLVFELDDFPKKTLFLNGADEFQYYNAGDLDDNIGEIIKDLLEKDLIYKKVVKVDMTNA